MNTKNRPGKCPVCNGTARMSADLLPYKSTWNYDAATNTVPCTNCGMKGMYSSGPDGWVQLRKDNGEPCKHDYTTIELGRCFYKYVCKHCTSEYTIDSGD